MAGFWDAIADQPLGIAMLVIVVAVVVSGRLIPRGWVREMREADRKQVEAAERDRDYWRDIALKTLGVVKRGVEAAEAVVAPEEQM